MIGGNGNDTYVVDNAGDIVNEDARRRAPTRCSPRSAYTLGADVENLTLTGAPISTATATPGQHSDRQYRGQYLDGGVALTR